MAQYIIVDDVLYHDRWMLPEEETLACVQADVIEIAEEVYTALEEAIEHNDEIMIDHNLVYQAEQPMEEPQPPAEQQATIEFIKNAKITEMNVACNRAIESGFSIILGDGKSHHFSLTTQDQLNLITLMNMVSSGEQEIPYHADGEPCKFYSAQDIGKIVEFSTAFKTWHISYVNSLKLYIESTNDIDTIHNIEYGVEIPAEHQSVVLAALIQEESRKNKEAI